MRYSQLGRFAAASFNSFSLRHFASSSINSSNLQFSTRAASSSAATAAKATKNDSAPPYAIKDHNEGFPPKFSSSSSSSIDSEDSQLKKRFGARESELPEYDVLIAGGGITGSALLYQLAAFTDIKRMVLVERRSEFGIVASGPNNNSQTIHCGDIETNYNYEKVAAVKRHADMMRNYATKLPEDMRNRSIYKMQKMVIGVGEEECHQLEQRHEQIKSLFPNARLVNKNQLRKLEPNVVRISNHRDRKDLVNAIVSTDEHSAVNYHHLANSFIQQAAEEVATAAPAATGAAAAAGGGGRCNRKLDINKNTEITNISLNEDESYTVYTTKGNLKARYVVVSTCGYSLLFAHKLGYGLKYACLPVAGSFYFCNAPVLVGKVYTVQDPKLPFAAVHGDPDIYAEGLTRFGPTALPVPMLERGNFASIKDYLKVSQLDLKTITAMLRLFRDPLMIRFALRNLFFELPYFGVRTFLEDTRKIVPGMVKEDLVYAKGFGGVRPQLIDRKKMDLVMGEGKIQGNNIVFNITPSPGGTTCLGNGEIDMRSICKALGAQVNEKRFEEILLRGLYNVA